MAPLVSVEKLTYSYPEGREDSSPTVRNVSFQLDAGEVVLLLGESGCGKSTVLRALNGLVPHFYGGTFAGRVRVAEMDTRSSRPRDLARVVGLVFQDPESQSVMTTVEREIAFGLENAGTPVASIGRLVEESLVALGLSHLRRATLSTLSGGELQKVALAAVLATQPQLLLLDEPTSQLDPVGAEELLSALRRLSEDTGTTIVLAEHRVDRCLHMAGRVLFMDSGDLVLDTTPSAFASWASTMHPEFLPPVTRLFAPGHRLPLTVRDARLAMNDGTERFAEPQWRNPDPVSDSNPASSTHYASHRANDSSADRGTLSVRRLSVGYPPDPPLLDDIDLELHTGRIVALLGENGCGKSTLICHFNGLRQPMAGSVAINGRLVSTMSVAEAARSCAILGQNPTDYFVHETLSRELDYSLEMHTQPGPARQYLREAIIHDLELSELLDRNPRDLSGGERTRAALALLACAHPPFLVLDEPTRGLDPTAKSALADLLARWAETGMGILVVTHDIEFAARCAHRVILLGDGGILADGPVEQVLDGSLFFSTQINRLLRHALPGVLRAEQVIIRDRETESAA
ncbi:MAG: energy-coupling factor ABC transporter ATP-binding protein [Actinobacteria bacterium]|nr:energy-coupling factor ABC transporter ATP-binding protein [Actinomycetota bacterium]